MKSKEAKRKKKTASLEKPNGLLNIKSMMATRVGRGKTKADTKVATCASCASLNA